MRLRHHLSMGYFSNNNSVQSVTCQIVLMATEQQSNPIHKRHIRSFIRRDSRLTAGQQNAIDSGWDRYGLEVGNQSMDLNAVFANTAPVIMEIGFGNGESLAKMAAEYPHYNFIGIETHKPGVGHLLIELTQRELDNVRIFNADVISVLSNSLAEQSISGIHIFFPDPWQKRRHHKRRLINKAFVQQITHKLCIGGHLFIATDWSDYGHWIEKILFATDCPLQEIIQNDQAKIIIPKRPQTKFESRGLGLGHIIREFRFFKQQ
jgi:tRNA (guanine-N7-)-methyltransferase